ncbi:protein of unknown function [Ruminococcaceae bacterium BL-4]|nr:protein of unknown function [Ruminococcaceae bacterium BL-4]
MTLGNQWIADFIQWTLMLKKTLDKNRQRLFTILVNSKLIFY